MGDGYCSEDDWYAELERRYSKTGYTWKEFARLTLESATKNEDGVCWPPNTTDYFGRMSLLIGMWRDGLIKRKNFGYHTPIEPYLITDKGRERLTMIMEPEPSNG